MKITKSRVLGAATAAAVAAGVLAAPSTNAQNYNVPKPVTIKMKAKGKKFFFAGPNSVEKGAKLTVVNASNPKKVGPHTASLVKPNLIPKGKKELKGCENLEGVCGSIAKAHKVEFTDEAVIVNKPDVDVGKKGWDKSFGKKGDTWYTETKGEDETRVVSAKAGSQITFFCVVHPTMVKKLKVK